MGITIVNPTDRIQRGGGSISISAAGALTATPKSGQGLTLPVAPAATANYGLLSLGSGPFDGVTAGFFAGSASGTLLAGNAASGFAGNLLDLQVGGVRRLILGANEGVTILGAGASAVYAANADNLLNVRGVGSSAAAWRGRITAGGDTVAFLFGEYSNQAWLGAHTADLLNWADLHISPDGNTTTYIGGAGTGLSVVNSNGRVGIGRASPLATLDVVGVGAYTSPVCLLTPGAYNNVIAENIDFTLAAHTVTITAGYATQRFALFGQPTITAATVQTVTDAATLAIGGPPLAAGSAVITNPWALWVQSGGVKLDSTITAPGTTGNQTINKPTGRVNIAAAGTTVTVTNSLVTANSIVLAVPATNDATARVTSVVPAAGSFTINTPAVTAETAFSFLVLS